MVLDLDDLGFVRETLIFKTWNISYMIAYKYVPPKGKLSNILIFPKL